MTTPNVQQTLSQARATWMSRFREAYAVGNGAFVTVAMIVGSLIALASSGDLNNATMLAACGGWMLAMPLVLALPASVAAGPYPTVAQYPEQLLVPVRVETNERDN
jgi:hypothetical protein